MPTATNTQQQRLQWQWSLTDCQQLWHSYNQAYNTMTHSLITTVSVCWTNQRHRYLHAYSSLSMLQNQSRLPCAPRQLYLQRSTHAYHHRLQTQTSLEPSLLPGIQASTAAHVSVQSSGPTVASSTCTTTLTVCKQPARSQLARRRRATEKVLGYNYNMRRLHDVLTTNAVVYLSDSLNHLLLGANPLGAQRSGQHTPLTGV